MAFYLKYWYIVVFWVTYFDDRTKEWTHTCEYSHIRSTLVSMYLYLAKEQERIVKYEE